MAASVELGEQLSLLRKAAGLSMEALASQAGVSRMTVQRIEAGADVRLQTLQDLLRVLGLELMLVPTALRPELQSFIQGQGKLIGQPVGVEAPPSAVDRLRKRSQPGSS
ncbi:helix-turn-helix transcriptional regulator [Roseateles paludis]|jgi:transcriptional regulator with XRE-family HTH domain|uniref:Helix-turn-helix transcriptional regulator n=1 Tax=Roseateles paludis TaxID=3145238 RepID=A0ABV0G4V5_9BURK